MRCSQNMTARFPCLLFQRVFRVFCCMFLLNVSAVFATDHLGPVFPRNTGAETGLTEPPPLPKKNPLLQRPQNRQVVFDGLDPVGSIIPQSLLYDEEAELLPQTNPPVPMNRRQTQPAPPRIAPAVDTHHSFFTDNGAIIHGENIHRNVIHGEIISEYPLEMHPQVIGPFPVAFGMGLFDNITLFAESTAFKTGLCGGAGILGFNEGINWSTAVTPQGAVTAQFGVRAVQGDLFNPIIREQLFMTAGLFKRFDFARVQGGVAVDWLTDRSQRGSHDLRQMRCELSAQILGSWETGFLGGFNVFPDSPMIEFNGRSRVVDVHDYYLLFVRKHLHNGGQVELRGGFTAHGDFMMNALGEVAISDRLAVNGGLSWLTPVGNHPNIHGNYRESWSMSMGVVVYFRGGAVFRQMNAHRPMFDVAGNNSFFTRMMP